MTESLRRIARLATWIAGAGFVLAALLVVVEVLLRRLFNRSFSGIDEISSYILAIGVMWSLAHALFEKGHIRVDLAYARVGPTARSILDVVALLAMAVVAGLLLRHGWGVLETSYSIGSRSNTPLGIRLWIPQALWFAGICFFMVVILTLLARALVHLLRGDHAGVTAVAGLGATEAQPLERAGD